MFASASTSIASDNVKQASNNLMKALKEQNEQSNYEEVDHFLKAAGGLKYRELFIDNGVEDLETILELDEKHLEQMSVPLGHKLKIMKRIKDIRQERGMYVPPSRQAGTTPREVVKDSTTAAVNDQGSTTATVEVKKEGGSLFDGDYDEEEQQRQFQQALDEWRNKGSEPKVAAGKATTNENNVVKKVRFAGEEVEEEKQQQVELKPKKSFLMTVGGDDSWNVVVMPQFDDKEI